MNKIKLAAKGHMTNDSIIIDWSYGRRIFFNNQYSHSLTQLLRCEMLEKKRVGTTYRKEVIDFPQDC